MSARSGYRLRFRLRTSEGSVAKLDQPISTLAGAVPRFKAVPPIWELRVGEHRVFYDVDDESKEVYVRAVRRQPSHKTTEEIL